MLECWRIFEEILSDVSKKYCAEIGSFVLMSNHFHMIIWTPNENLDEIMNHLLREVSKKINKSSNRINHVFGGPYKWSLITTQKYLVHAYRYLYQNPIRSKITKKAEEYPYSTLYKLINRETIKFKVFDDRIANYCDLESDVSNRLGWMNEVYSQKQSEVIRICLNRKVFRYPAHKDYRPIVSSLDK